MPSLSGGNSRRLAALHGPRAGHANQPPDRRTDIYGLGAVAYFMLTGRPPFLGENPMEVMVAHARDPVTPPSQLTRRDSR